ncbi:selenocysteine-specific translation elongation factor, partial [Saccharothrix sp. MB29]|nr:selenocysteine-specific translation elongation factor [Saccharothrix sp. MB29]
LGLVREAYTTGGAPEAVAAWRAEQPLAAGMPADVLARRLDVPAELVAAVVDQAGLRLVDGRVPTTAALPAPVERAVAAVEADLARSPFAAPDANRLAGLGLGPRELAAAV